MSGLELSFAELCWLMQISANMGIRVLFLHPVNDSPLTVMGWDLRVLDAGCGGVGLGSQMCPC